MAVLALAPFSHTCEGMDEMVRPRLRELAPAERGKEASSRNLGSNFFLPYLYLPHDAAEPGDLLAAPPPLGDVAL